MTKYLTTQSSNKVARIENRFIFNAQYQLTAREQKVILYLISNIDPKSQKRFHEQVISVKKLESVLKADGKKWGGLYEEMQSFTDRILDKKIRFPTDLEIDGRSFPGKINWFQSVMPVRNENQEVSLRFLFAEDLKPFLLQLNEYAQINRLEAQQMKSGHAIRMFQIFKAQRDRMRRHEKVSKLTYEVNSLKAILGIEGKYPRFNSFRERVLDTIKKEINTYTSLELINLVYTRSGKRVTALTFVFTEKEKESNTFLKVDAGQAPTEESLAHTFTKSQLRAYKLLVKRNIIPGIAYERIVPVISQGSSEFIGFEDIYFEFAWAIFENKSNLFQKGSKLTELEARKKAGTFVNWFTKNKVFQQGDHFATIQSLLAEKKKHMQRNYPDEWDLRLKSKGIPAAEIN
jgi:plasmid replication initiation protein